MATTPTAASAAGSAPITRVPGILAAVTDLFRQAIAEAFPDFAAESAPMVTPTKEAKFGEYQCNNAMQLHGKLKAKAVPGFKAPRDVAVAIVAKAGVLGTDMIEKMEIAGPGFINVYLRRGWVAGRLESMLKDGVVTWEPSPPGGRRKIIVDFSSPNIAKEMHVGHLRSTIIGDTLCRLFERAGAEVLRTNHVGDWGTQFGMLLEYMREQESGSTDDAGVADLQVFYKAAKQRFDEDEAFKKRSQLNVVALQAGDADSTAKWRRICDVSRAEFQAVYARLGVTLTEKGESFYNSRIPAVIDELTAKGMAVQSDGATCVFIEGTEQPLIVRKGDGGYGYASTDMTAVKYRLYEEKADQVVYVTDVGQKGHFDMVFAAAAKAGWVAETGARLDHCGFGLVMGEDGKKFKTRSGAVVRLVELLDEAKRRCRESLLERGRLDAMEEEGGVDACAEAMGYGAVKYADLRNNRLTNYQFSYDRMLDTKGNTAVYLLYAHARIASIVRKYTKAPLESLIVPGAIQLVHPTEWALALQMSKFPEVLSAVMTDLAPHYLCEFLYDVSVRFNDFYAECTVLESPEETSRLLLAEATARVMRESFHLLGIRPLMKI